MSHSGGVDINYYLKTLEDYNQKYGPRPQNADGTGGQNYGVRASNQAPGYGYINPETNNLFPLNEPGSQGAGGVGASGSFENYLRGLNPMPFSISKPLGSSYPQGHYQIILMGIFRG